MLGERYDRPEFKKITKFGMMEILGAEMLQDALEEQAKARQRLKKVIVFFSDNSSKGNFTVELTLFHLSL